MFLKVGITHMFFDFSLFTICVPLRILAAQMSAMRPTSYNQLQLIMIALAKMLTNEETSYLDQHYFNSFFFQINPNVHTQLNDINKFCQIYASMTALISFMLSILLNFYESCVPMLYFAFVIIESVGSIFAIDITTQIKCIVRRNDIRIT